nr:Rne/Rng family ribonuclease [Bacillus sp. B15-48]
MVINALTREKRFALLKNDKLERLYIEQPKHKSLVGDLFLGTVEKVIPGMNAAFVDFGEEKKGFLYRDKVPKYVLDENKEKKQRNISAFLHQGEKLLVQVEKDAAGTKGARLSAIIELSGKHIIYMPTGKYIAVSKKLADPKAKKCLREFGEQLKTGTEGLIFRTSSAHVQEDILERELNDLREQYQQLEKRAKNMRKPGLIEAYDAFYDELIQTMDNMSAGEVIIDDLPLKKKLEQYGQHLDVSYYHDKENIFSVYELEKEIERAMRKTVWLENGAYLIFDEAEALTIVDVNTGKYSGKTELTETVFKTNKLAAVEVARQLRLRDIGGMVLIDFIDMKDVSDREAVVKVMETSLAEDGRRTRIIGFTELGILQLTRKKTKLSISEALTTSCPTCTGTGKVLSAETVAFRLERELWEYRHVDEEAVFIAATPDVIEVFSGNGNVHRSRIEESVGLKIVWSETSASKPEYRILQLGSTAEFARKGRKET